jgi:hypothetical protein
MPNIIDIIQLAACVLHTPSPQNCSGAHTPTTTPNHDTSEQPCNNVPSQHPTWSPSLLASKEIQHAAQPPPDTYHAISTMGSHHLTMPHFDSGDSVHDKLVTYMPNTHPGGASLWGLPIIWFDPLHSSLLVLALSALQLLGSNQSIPTLALD